MRPAILTSSVSAPCANAASTAATSAAATLQTLVLTNPWPGISCQGSRPSTCKANNCNSVNHTHLIFRSVKAVTEAWIALEDVSEEEEINGEEEEKEEETDV